MSPQCLPPSFGSIWFTIQEQMRFEYFQDGHLGGYLRYWNRTILAILNLYVTPMTLIKSGFNLHYGLGEVVWRISRWLPSWISEWNKLGSSESPQCLPPSFSLIRLTVQEQMSFQDFQDGHHGGHLGDWNGMNLAIQNLHVIQMPSIKFGLNPTPFCSRHNLKIFKMTTVVAILDIRMERF